MTDAQTQESLRRADREKRRVAASSLAAAVLLTGTKLGVGLWTNSLGILSEAAHSGLDLVAAAVTLWAVRVSSRPADREHTYGHGKIENLSALFETVLLLGHLRLDHLRGVEPAASSTPPSTSTPTSGRFSVVILSIVVDLSRSRALKKAADKYSSQALEADALHFSTDIWSSAVVLLGLCGVRAADGSALPWLQQADAVAALGVAVIVIWVSLKLGKKSVDDLWTASRRGCTTRSCRRRQAGRRRRGRHAAAAAPQRAGNLRRRDHGRRPRRGLRAGARHRPRSRSGRGRASCPTPTSSSTSSRSPPATEDVTTIVRLLAARHGLGAHGIRIYEEDRQRWLELHLEVSDSLLLDEAHRQATDFERALRQSLPGVTRIITHIEPTGDAAATIRGQPAGQVAGAEGDRRFLCDHIRCRSSRTTSACNRPAANWPSPSIARSTRPPPSPTPTS